MGGGYGLFGKIPGAGDFLRRGLSPGFVQAWDAWMQGLLVAGRTALGERWQEAYFTAPIWRFAIGPGVAGASGAVGVVMPSVDRVGRQFPLCLAAETAEPAWSAYMSAAGTFDQLETVALASLDEGGTPETLEHALSTVPAPLPVPEARPFRIGRCTAMTTTAPLPGAAAIPALAPAGSIWISAIDGQNRLLTHEGLPESGAEAAAFFDLADPAWTLGGRS